MRGIEGLNYPLAYAPISIDYTDENGNMIHIGYIPNLCYVVGSKRNYNSDGTCKSKYEVVFVDKIVDFENKIIETSIPKYEERHFGKYCCNFENKIFYS